MASYTIEDIELIRRKSGISYQEAVALLDYHNGNVARALVDLERNGRIKPEAEVAADNREKMVRNAAQNVKASVSSMAQEFTAATGDDKPAAPASQAAQPETEQRSYYQANPAATTYHASYGGSAPTLQVPVQVESQDGSVSVESDKDGFTNATIE